MIEDIISIWKDVVTIHKQNAETKRALRLLSKQEWSVEFLTALLVRASKATKQDLEMTLTDKLGRSITINTLNVSTSLADDNILDHLDNEVAIQNFIHEMERKR